MKALFCSEWKRIWYPIFSKRYTAAAIVLGLTFSIILLVSLPYTQQKTAAELSAFDIVSVALLSMDVLAVMLIIFLALIVAGEFSNGGIRAGLLVSPARKRLMAAKIAGGLAYAVLLSAIMAAGVVMVCSCTLLFTNRPLSELLQMLIIRMVSGSMLMPVFYAFLACTLAFLFRSTGKTITAVLAVMLLPAAANLVSESAEKLLLSVVPSSALHTLAGIAGSSEQMSIAGAVVVLGGWIVLSLGAAVWHFVGKDV